MTRPSRYGGARAAGASDPRSQARDTLTREVGFVKKPHGGRVRVALAFPNTYFVGMSNLGLQTTYKLFNADERAVCERVFLPPKQDLGRWLARGEPLVTIESQTPVRQFDIFAFSVSFEWDYTNVLTLLRLAGLEAARGEPARARSADRDRRRRDVRQSRTARAVRGCDRRGRSRAPRARARRRLDVRARP